MRKLVIAAAALALPSAGHAATFINGSFEDASISPGGYATLTTGSTVIDGWTVGGSIDYIGSYWVAADGNRSIDLSGSAPGSISQTFDTDIGQTYLVQFMMSGNPAGAPTTKTLDVTVNATGAESYTFNIGANSLSDMQWVQQSYTFTATQSTTTLAFTSINSGDYFGPALDKVSVTAVPEPASWAMMIGGFAFAGAFMRRRAARGVRAFA